MKSGSIIFMTVSWVLVIGLMSWSYSRVLKKKAHHDPDSLGPGVPPVRGTHDGIVPPPSDH